MIARVFAVLFAAAALGACAGVKSSVSRGFDFSRLKRVAVIDFADDPRLAGSGETVASAFELSLVRAGYDVVEPDRVGDVLRDLKLSSGELNAKDAAAAGRMLKVDALVEGRITALVLPREVVVAATVVTGTSMDEEATRGTNNYHRVRGSDGTLLDVKNEDYTTIRTHVDKLESAQARGRLGVSARMVDAGTGAVLWSGSEILDSESIDDAARDAAEDILHAVKRTWPVVRKK